MKSTIYVLLVASISAAKLHYSELYLNDPDLHDRMFTGAGFFHLETSACLTHKVD